MLLGHFGCGGGDRSMTSRTGQDEIPIPPLPYFTSVNWPAPYTELPEGRLVITGNLQCPAGFFEEQPIGVEMWAVALIDPPLPEVTDPPPVTQEELQGLLEANPTVQQWMEEARSGSFRRITDGPYVRAEHWTDLTKGYQSWGLFSEGFDDYNYFDYGTGDFMIDFDNTKRLLPAGDVLIFVKGQDQTGMIDISMNIFSVPHMLSPEIRAELDSEAIAFADSLVGLGDALTEVMAVSGDDRGVDIALIAPFLTLIDESYGDGYSDPIKEIAAVHLGDSGAAVANLIPEIEYKAIYNAVVDYCVQDYAHDGYSCWSRHFVNLPTGTDFLEKQQEAIQYLFDDFRDYSEQYILTERGGGIKELSVQVYEGEDIVAQFTVIGDPANPLVILGYIGEHSIVPDDYNPYVVELLAVFESEHIIWPASGI